MIKYINVKINNGQVQPYKVRKKTPHTQTNARWPAMARLLVVAVIVILFLTTKKAQRIELRDGARPLPGLELTMVPDNMTSITKHHVRNVHITCSANNDTTRNNTVTHGVMPVTLVVRVESKKPELAEVYYKDGQKYEFDNQSRAVVMELQVNSKVSFVIGGVHVGYASIHVDVYHTHINYSHFSQLEDLTLLKDMGVVWHKELTVTVGRKARTCDSVFDSAVALIAVMNAFSVGCSAEWRSLMEHARNPRSLLTALVCQFLLIPPLAVGVSATLSLAPHESLGLIIVVCVPGGGLGHIIVNFIQADHELSIAINFTAILLTIFGTPIWLVVWWLYTWQSSWPITVLLGMLWRVEAWLVAGAASAGLGLLLSISLPHAAQAVLTWLVKPLLLLCALLFSTLGIYINNYIFESVDIKLPSAAGILPVLGGLTGTLATYVVHRNVERKKLVKVISVETTIFNCLTAIVIARYSLGQPDADLTSTIAFWVLFLTPVPFITAMLYRTFLDSLRHRCAKRKEAKYRHFSIASSLANVTNITNLSSPITPNTTSHDDVFEDALLNHNNNDDRITDIVTVV